MGDKAIRGLNCPSCGGTLDIREGRNTVECGFCGSTLIISGESGLPCYFVRDKITREQVKQATFKWMGTVDKSPDLQRSYKIQEIFLVFVPLYRIRAHALGWILGKNERKSQDRTDYDLVEKKIDKIYDWNTPSCDLRELGVEWVNLEGDVLEPFSVEQVQPRGMIFDPTIPPSEPVKKAFYKFQDWSMDEAAVDLVTFDKIHFLQKKVSLVYYPLWIFRYRYRNRTYQVVYDGEDGSMVHGTAPGNNFLRVLMLVGTMFLGMLFLTSALRSGDMGVAFLGFLMASALMFFGYMKFRYGCEVIYKMTPKGPEINTMAKIKKKLTIDGLIEMARKVK
ncbi:MAG: hypothetical protein K8T10_08335 [Candidatus Eremiobacteraeota bacterium]|nr:hypothetical protein [Candidatus Eremiobacteraeota bacterium]